MIKFYLSIVLPFSNIFRWIKSYVCIKELPRLKAQFAWLSAYPARAINKKLVFCAPFPAISDSKIDKLPRIRSSYIPLAYNLPFIALGLWLYLNLNAFFAASDFWSFDNKRAQFGIKFSKLQKSE